MRLSETIPAPSVENFIRADLDKWSWKASGRAQFILSKVARKASQSLRAMGCIDFRTIF